MTTVLAISRVTRCGPLYNCIQGRQGLRDTKWASGCFYFHRVETQGLGNSPTRALYIGCSRDYEVGMSQPLLAQLESSLEKAEEVFASQPVVGEKARAIHTKLLSLLADVATERIRGEHAQTLRLSAALSGPRLDGLLAGGFRATLSDTVGQPSQFNGHAGDALPKV